MGGFVRWYMGSDKNGTDSLAKQIVPASHWSEMRILVLVVKKEIFLHVLIRKIDMIIKRDSRDIYKSTG